MPVCTLRIQLPQHMQHNDIADFQRIYKQETGMEQAKAYAERLIRFLAFICEAGPKESE